jgi:tricorn protease
MTFRFGSLALVVCSLFAATPARTADIHDTRLLTDPAVSSDHVAFSYANDLWIADLDGSGVRRLTSHNGVESNPRFSPDGRMVAFTGEYDRNFDVFVVPVTGGVPERLTWHPSRDDVLGFTQDSSAVLFSSDRQVYTRRYSQFFTVPVSGGAADRLPIPHGFDAAYSPDGSKLVYRPLGERFRQWKGYRGGTTARLLVFDTEDYSTEQIPQPEGRCNDTQPMWLGDSIYFLSDRNGEFNLFVFDPATQSVEQLTKHSDFPVLSAGAGGGRILYEQAGYLHLFNPASKSSTRLRIGVPADLIETRPRFASGGEHVRGASLSPSGARAVFEVRGEIVTVPAEKGNDRNITNSPGAHDRSPIWSPDGKWVAWLSDASGEYLLRIAAQDGRGETRTLALEGAGFYEDPKWSPDSKRISYTDNSHSLHILDVGSGEVEKVSSQVLYSPVKTLHHAWSPDSRWLAYTQNTLTYTHTVNIYSLEDKRSYPITQGLADAKEPVFDTGGKYLYFLASTDAGPVEDWFAQSGADMRSIGSIYLAVLAKDVPSPLAKESDEEMGGEDEDKNSENGDNEPVDDAEQIEVRVDFEGMDQRILVLPVPAAGYSNVRAGSEGQLFYLKDAGGHGQFGPTEETSLQRFDLEEREDKTLLEKADGFELSADSKKILVVADDKWSISEVEDTIDTSKHQLALDEIQIRIAPEEEWPQIFHEAWRINRDYFYDPGMHGADWVAIREKYAAFLPHLSTRRDLNRVMRWMASELQVGHSRVAEGDDLFEIEAIPGGLLGADIEVAGDRYRFAKVYGGLNWNPELRSPLTEPGVDVQEGEYLLAVEGKALRYPENLYRRFERTADRIVQITVGPNPDGKDSRTVDVVPIANERALRNRDWVEGNLRKVTEASGGRVAYVWLPNTAGAGHEYFKRYFFPQADREAIIIDERHNGGGLVADYYIDILRRPHIGYWAMRYGEDLESPLAAIQGPKIMLIDETAGSGGDLLPWMFRKFELGTIVGKRTWGGLVGTLGFPDLMDGGGITAPNLAFWTADDDWAVENIGVPPDIEVEQTPSEVIAGHDPQLERALELIMEQLEASPPETPKRPAFPVKSRD